MIALKPRPFVKQNGGKFQLMMRFIRPRLPDTAVFVDVFSATAGALLGNLYPAPHEHAGDLDLRFYKLFQVLEHQGDEFERIISNKLYHEQVYSDAWATLCLWDAHRGDQLLMPGAAPMPTDLELAVALFICSMMGRDHSLQSASFAVVRNNPNGGHDRAKNYANMERIEYARDRLRGVHWYVGDFMGKLDFFDVPITDKERKKRLFGTMIYIDPPYWKVGLKMYLYGWTARKHAKFLDRILKIEHAYVAISMDDSELYETRLVGAGWDVQKTTARNQSNAGGQSPEWLYRNPACMAEWERQRESGNREKSSKQEEMQLWQS